jgi:protein O-GlcNAc transferase
MRIPGLQNTVAEARWFYAAGTLAAADAICRAIVEEQPSNAHAWELLAQVAAAVLLPQHAREYASRALWIDPARQLAARIADEVKEAPPAPPGERFLLIKAWGNGFFSDVDHTLAMLLVAEITGRTPIIHWGSNSLFGGTAEHDAFRDFFEPVSSHTLGELRGRGLDFFPQKWNDGNLASENINKWEGPESRLWAVRLLGRSEAVVVSDFHTGMPLLLPWVREGHPLQGKSIDEAYRYLIGKYLRPRQEILAGVESFAAEKFTGLPIIAVHARGSDKFVEDPQLDAKLGLYPGAIAHLAGGAAARVFLLTDSMPVRESFARRYGDSLITTEAVRTGTRTGLHLSGHADTRRLGTEVLTDALLAARCDAFVGLGSSNVSCIINHLRQWPEDKRVIIGRLMTHTPNPYLYMTREQVQAAMSGAPGR